jgi:hypothetical protein
MRTGGKGLAHILDLLAEDSWLNVYAGELDVRPLGAPTIQGRDKPEGCLASSHALQLRRV